MEVEMEEQKKKSSRYGSILVRQRSHSVPRKRVKSRRRYRMSKYYEDIASSSENISRNFLGPPFLFPSMDELSVISAEREERKKSGKDFGLAQLTRKQKFLIFMLAFANFCSTVVFSCIAPFFPQEAAKKGATKTEIGLIFGIFELVIFFTSPIMGKYLTKIGVKFMYGSGLFITGVTTILFGLLTMSPDGTPFVALCFTVRIVEAVGDAMFLTASFSIVSYNFPGRVASIIGVLETFSGLGFTAGPAVGGLLYQAGGFKAPFLALGSLLFFAGILSVPMIPSHKDAPRNEKGKGMLGLLKIPAIILMCFAVIVCAICLTFLDPTLEPHLSDFNLSPTVVGLMFLLTGGIYTLTAPAWGYYIDRSDYVREIMIGGAFCGMLAMFFIGPSPVLGFEKKLWLIGLSQVTLGFGMGALFIPTFKCTLDVALDHGYAESFQTYGIVSGLFQSTFSMGGFLGPTIGGVAVDYIGFAWTTSILAGCNLFVAVAMIIFRVVQRCKESKEEEEEDSLLEKGDIEDMYLTKSDSELRLSI